MAGSAEKERAIAVWEAMRRSRQRRTHTNTAVVAAAVALVVLALVLTVHHFLTTGIPQRIAAVPAPPTMHLRGHSCDGQDWAPRAGGISVGRVTVDADPTGAVVFWIPGLNSRRCRVDVTALTTAQANSVAQAVRDTRTTGGAYSCPDDDGSAAWVFFRYAGRSDLDLLKAELTGCQFDSAPLRGSSGPAWQVAGILQRLEPAAAMR